MIGYDVRVRQFNHIAKAERRYKHLEELLEECISGFDEKYLELQNRIFEITKMEDELLLKMDALSKKLDLLSKSADKSVERWTWDRYKRIEERLLPKIDKSAERWTWERFCRARREREENTWNIIYEMNHERMQDSIGNNLVYDDSFYFSNRYGSVVSAQHILRKVFEWLPHDSVVDFGCGSGTWLFVAQALGANEILGIDGDYVPRGMLMIPEDCFLPANLEHPIKLQKRFDFAMSLEVAEHLDAASADGFVESLCNASDVVLFSAAHPGQGGDHHVNEQPIEYWIEKFEKRGYETVDISGHFKDDQKILHWYRENIVLFAQKDLNFRIREDY